MGEIRRLDEKSTQKPYKPVSRSDFFPKLVTLQKRLNARNAVIYKLSSGGMPNRRRLVPVLDSFNEDNRSAVEQIIETYGPMLMEHIEDSALPLMFNGARDEQTAEAPDFIGFVGRLRGRQLDFSGVIFPVRLGAMGNGLVVFTATYLDVSSEMIIDMHHRCHQLMKDLLTLDERKSAPNEVLSPREIACLQMAGDGLISEEIAERLGLSVHTVNAYLAAATTKLDSVNRIQAIAKAIRLGFIA